MLAVIGDEIEKFESSEGSLALASYRLALPLRLRHIESGGWVQRSDGTGQKARVIKLTFVSLGLSRVLGFCCLFLQAR